MQFDSPATYNNPKHHGSTMNMNTDYSMYLPGMGRIAPKPIIAVQRKKVNDDGDLKKVISTPSIEKSTTDAAKQPEMSHKCERIIDPAVECEVQPIVNAESPGESPKVIHYRVWPGGPIKTFRVPMVNATTNKAATALQKMVRGKCARTNYYIRKLELRVAAMNEQRIKDVAAIQADMEKQKILVRRKVTQKQASLLKVQLDTKKTATQGSELINYLRKENKKLRQKNEKIAASIQALRLHNEQLESLTSATGENQNLLGTHYDKIQETNTLLLSVVPQYESKLSELREALEVRQQYCDVENHMKVLYMKSIGTITEMMEQDSNDPELIQEIMQFCADLPSEILPPSTPLDTTVSADEHQEDHLPAETDNQENMSADPTEYDEVSVLDNTNDADDDDDDHVDDDVDDDDDTDSNNYDDYTIAGMD